MKIALDSLGNSTSDGRILDVESGKILFAKPKTEAREQGWEKHRHHPHRLQFLQFQQLRKIQIAVSDTIWFVVESASKYFHPK